MHAQLSEQSASVFVSLARNDLELARAAVDAGADGLKVHLNVSHRASGNRFGDLDEEGETIEAIGKLDIPLGVVPGQDLETVRETVPKLADYPVDFVDSYGDHCPPEIQSLTDRTVWVASGDEYGRTETLTLDDTGVDVVELSVQPKSRYGESMTMRDLAQYVDLVDAIDSPVVIPSQLALTPTDAVALAERGVTNFLLGSVVTDDTPDSVHETVDSFVTALADV
jgi:hypothetical protein